MEWAEEEGAEEGERENNRRRFVHMAENEDFDSSVADIQRMIMEAVRARYSKKVIEEANNPKNVGRMGDPDGCGVIHGPCGDTMEFYLKVNDGKIERILFMTDGCGPTIACGSMVTSMVSGKELDKAAAITQMDLIDALDGLPDEHRHCAKLAVDTLREAIGSTEKKDSESLKE